MPKSVFKYTKFSRLKFSRLYSLDNLIYVEEIVPYITQNMQNMEMKTTSERFMPLVINLASVAASIVGTAACETLSKKLEKKNKKFLSKAIGGVGNVSTIGLTVSTLCLPFTAVMATQKYNYTADDLDNELHLLSEAERQDILKKGNH